jgi:hypothetical protein
MGVSLKTENEETKSPMASAIHFEKLKVYLG